MIGKGNSRREFLISHYPYQGDHTEGERYTQYRLRDEGKLLFHGHLHTQDIVTGARQIHVGADAHDFRPVPEGDLLELVRFQELNGWPGGQETS